MYRAAFSALLAIIVWAQLAPAQLTTGTISGTVKDESGAVVPGVTVTARNVDTGMAREVATDAQGRYRAPNLPLGNYEVQTGLSGFQTAVRTGITLMVGQEAVVDFTLKVGEVSAKIEVTGEAPLVEPTRSDVSGVIEERQVSDLPLNGRSFLQLAQLQPGVVATRATVNISFGGKAQVLATGGSQPTTGLFLLDGTDISDYLFATSPGGASGLAIGVDMIREFRVLTNSFSAEYGRTAGGVLAVVSKGGTNKLEGTLFWFHRNDNLDARDFFAVRKPEFKRNQWGATVGGPIIKDKTFFLGSFEGLREGLGRSSVAIVPNAQAHEGILPASLGGNVGVASNVKPFLDYYYPLPTGQDFGNGTAEWRGNVNQPTDENFFSARIDHILSEKDTLFGRYTFRDGLTSDPFGSSLLPGFAGVGDNRTQYVSAEETHVFSPTLLNTLRAAFNRNSRNNPVEPAPPGLSISLMANRGLGVFTVGGVSTIGQRISRPAFNTLNLYQVTDTLDLTRGRHSVKAGAEVVRYQTAYDYQYNFNGSYRFNTLRDLLAGRSSQFTGMIPGSDARRDWRWSSYAFFVQDEFKAFSSFTLNLGLRYEPYTNPHENQDKFATLIDPFRDTTVTKVKSLFGENPGSKLFMPRVGFAWDPFQNGKLAIRGGFGVYFDRLHANLMRGSHSNPPFATQIQVNNPPFPNPLAGGAVISPALVSLAPMFPYRGFSYPYAMQWNFTLQREIVPGTVATASYAGSRGVHVIVQGNLDLNQWEFRDGRKFFPAGSPLLNPAFGYTFYQIPMGNSSYHALQLGLKRRWSQGLQFQASYTWSKAIDNGTTFGTVGVGNASSGVPDLFDMRLSRGLADIDVRHNFVSNISYQLPFGGKNRLLGGWQVGGIVSLVSGIPFSQLLSFDRSRSNSTGGSSGGITSYGPDRLREAKVESRNVDRYYDMSAFRLEDAGYFGNAGRNSLIGPGLATVDFSVIKNTPITERVNVQWRFELFNLFNRGNFATPGDAGTGSGGSVMFTDAGGIPVPTAGKILRTVTSARQIQMGLKLSF